MDLNRKNVRKLKGLIIFTAIVCLAVIKFDWLCMATAFLFGIIKPFIVGGMIAFVINIPMKFFENKFFGDKGIKPGKGKYLRKCRRGLSLVLAYLAVGLVITLVVITVIPQLIATIKILTDKIPPFADSVIKQLEVIFAENPELLAQLSNYEAMEINWKEIINTVVGFLKSGMGSVLSSTFTVASSIITSMIDLLISFIFSIYILVQKEKLGEQCTKVIAAYTNPKILAWVQKVSKLLYQNFSHFIIGQCTEALILGAMFIVTMTVFRFNYAVMVGILIAFMSLIPIVGAFIGCFVGAFLMLVDDPVKAIWFLVLFIILQQIEGNLIYPHVVGNSVGLPSIWVLAAVTIGGSLMGVFGMLIFIPLLSTVYMLLREDVNRRNA